MFNEPSDLEKLFKTILPVYPLLLVITWCIYLPQSIKRKLPFINTEKSNGRDHIRKNLEHQQNNRRRS